MKNNEVEILYQDSLHDLEGNLSDVLSKFQKVNKKYTKLGYTNIKIELIINSYKLAHSMVRITGVKTSKSLVNKLLKILSIS